MNGSCFLAVAETRQYVLHVTACRLLLGGVMSASKGRAHPSPTYDRGFKIKSQHGRNHVKSYK